MEYRVSIDQCPHGNHAVSLDNQTNETGTRLVGRCCKRWTRAHSWRVSADELRSIAEEFEAAANDSD
jgi:hypothetical protein